MIQDQDSEIQFIVKWWVDKAIFTVGAGLIAWQLGIWTGIGVALLACSVKGRQVAIGQKTYDPYSDGK